MRLETAIHQILAEGFLKKKIEVPQRVLDHAKKVGLPQKDTEQIFAAWQGRQSTDWILKKIENQAESDRRERMSHVKDPTPDSHNESVELDEAVDKIACVDCDEVSTAAAWKKNRGFCPICKKSNKGVAEEVELDEATDPHTPTDLYKKASKAGFSTSSVMTDKVYRVAFTQLGDEELARRAADAFFSGVAQLELGKKVLEGIAKAFE